jgi:FO synthase
MTELVNTETSLFPHANPGLMSTEDMAGLRASNPSMGLMLENVSPRLMEPGMPHYGCPDKDPARRLAVIESAGMLRVAFTSGVLVGIGETNRELVDSVFALAGLQRRLGCIQEVIVQNFRAKNDTPMRRHAEPIPVWVARVAAMTRWVMGAEMNVQVPPNLTDNFGLYLEAGINDWGGVSPLTIDFVNPERPWPHLQLLKARTEAAGFRLLPRLPIYPEFITSEWLAPELVSKVSNSVDDHGYALAPQMEGAFS